jgi:hypothetical protein
VAPSADALSGWDDDEDDDDWDAPEPPRADAAPLRLDNPVRSQTRGWDTDIDDLDAKAGRASADREEETASREASYLEGARKAAKMASPARAMLTEQRVEDNDTSRILDQTNEELEEPEGNRRRSAIAHLRAAVAATRADRLLGRGRDAEQVAEPYREDLANVVRPRRPQAAPNRAERPAAPTPRPTPLKLVAEQRIAEQQAAPVQPVRPRRIDRSADAPPPVPGPRREERAEPAMGDGFAEYAQSVGARSLPEMIEAAAAFLTYEKRQDSFSRPQLMSALRQAEAAESSREDRLRLFGQLLREGKIQKSAGGRFTVSEDIRFKPRRAAG